jgi:hypothetical protein
VAEAKLRMALYLSILTCPLNKPHLRARVWMWHALRP